MAYFLVCFRLRLWDARRLFRLDKVVCGGGMKGLALAQEGQGAREPATELTALGRYIEHGKRVSRGPFWGWQKPWKQ
jgi:hypothetical protein